MASAFQYSNRKGGVYYLQATLNKAGRTSHSLAMKPKGSPVEKMPPGYEAWESPEDARVVIRRRRASAISPEEKRLLEKVISEKTQSLPFIVDVERDALVVYIADIEDELECWRRNAPEVDLNNLRSRLLARADYTKMLRFNLTDAENRLFSMDRWCFRGSIDNWITLAHGKPLQDLASRYVVHLGKESFYELMTFRPS